MVRPAARVAEVTAVTADRIAFSYGTVTALRSVSLEVARGEMFALVGPDGAGKTTLLRLVAGLLRPAGGTLTVHGGRAAEEIGYLSQGFSLYRDLSVEENLRFFADLYGVDDYAARRGELLGFTRLDRFADRLAGRLSGGMKKKLALACALIHRPSLLLLDEPTTGVDPVSRRDFWLILGELLREGLTIVVTSPYLDEAERCDRVGLLRDGSLLFAGTPDEARRELSGSMIEIVCSDPRAARTRLQRFVGGSISEIYVLGDRISLRLPEAGIDAMPPEVARELGQAGIDVVDVRSIAATLEHVFLSLVARDEGGRS